MSNNGNILHLKQVLPGGKSWAENDTGNTIAYDVKSRQFKTTIVNYTGLRLNGLKISTAQRRDVGKTDKYVTQILNFK